MSDTTTPDAPATTTPAEEAEPAQWLSILYVCPRCAHEWHEEWSCACDSECPECNLENIEATEWEDA